MEFQTGLYTLVYKDTDNALKPGHTIWPKTTSKDNIQGTCLNPFQIKHQLRNKAKHSKIWLYQIFSSLSQRFMNSLLQHLILLG